MEAAYAAGAVDSTVFGDWEDVQVDLGLLDERVTFDPRPVRGAPPKARRKAEKQARKRNRKRK
jgi:hypothetical protein